MVVVIETKIHLMNNECSYYKNNVHMLQNNNNSSLSLMHINCSP